jgi:xanthine dehydrogenase accessory factor
MKKVWSFIEENLLDRKRVVLLVVVDNQGSSPGQAGFKMAVSEDNLLKGSVGGGQTEYRLVEKARKSLGNYNTATFLKQEVHQPEAEVNRSGMICSGEQWVAFYPLDYSNLELVKTINNAAQHGVKGLLRFDQHGISFEEGERLKHQHKDPVTSNSEWHYLEETGNELNLYIFGAGHVGLALSQVMSHLDFRIHIFDDREDLPTLLENTFTDFSQIVDYRKIEGLVEQGENSYVVIMTFGHKSDEVVLRQMIGKEMKYLGMMGSSRKVAQIYQNLRDDGFEERDIEKVHAPIGIPIDSQTPFEIAVSIAAQLIHVKNKLEKAAEMSEKTG